LTNFAPTFQNGTVRGMRDSLIKEIRVGITAARSGMNLQTKFKKKNETINDLLGKYLDCLEERSLNRIDENIFKLQLDEWEDMIKTRMPKFYKMEAKTVFLNYYDLEGIRREITDDLEPFYSSKIKNLMFATSAKVYPYQNQITSVRIILAKFYRIPEEDIGKEDIQFYKEEFAKAGKEIEEEKDDDDDLDGNFEENKQGGTVGGTTGGPTAGPSTKNITTKQSPTTKREDVYKDKNVNIELTSKQGPDGKTPTNK